MNRPRFQQPGKLNYSITFTITNKDQRMKKAAFFLTLALWLAACGNNTPKGIATKFLECLATKEYDQAKEYCTLQAAAVVEMARRMDSERLPEPGRYQVLRDTVVGNHAWVFYKEKKGADDETIKMSMVKEEGKWKVDAKAGK